MEELYKKVVKNRPTVIIKLKFNEVVVLQLLFFVWEGTPALITCSSLESLHPSFPRLPFPPTISFPHPSLECFGVSLFNS